MTDSHEPEPAPTENSQPEVEADDDGGMVKPFLDHLEDLRWMIIKMLITVVVAVVLAFFFSKELLGVILWPLQRLGVDPREFLISFDVTGGFTLSMKLALYAGVILSCPLLLYFLAQFILPALTDREKGLLNPVFGFGVGLFLAGVAMAYFVVIPAGLRFFLDYNKYLGIKSQWTIESYSSFVSQMCLAFGLCFEMPLVVLALAKLGLVSHKFLREKRAYAIVINFVIAAIITPTTDPFNQSLLAVPMCVLYEACIWIAWWMERKKKQEEDDQK